MLKTDTNSLLVLHQQIFVKTGLQFQVSHVTVLQLHFAQSGRVFHSDSVSTMCVGHSLRLNNSLFEWNRGTNRSPHICRPRIGDCTECSLFMYRQCQLGLFLSLIYRKTSIKRRALLLIQYHPYTILRYFCRITSYWQTILST